MGLVASPLLRPVHIPSPVFPPAFSFKAVCSKVSLAVYSNSSYNHYILRLLPLCLTLYILKYFPLPFVFLTGNIYKRSSNGFFCPYWNTCNFRKGYWKSQTSSSAPWEVVSSRAASPLWLPSAYHLVPGPWSLACCLQLWMICVPRTYSWPCTLPSLKGNWGRLIPNRTALNLFGKETPSLDFPGGPVVKNLPGNAGDMGWIPGPGRFHVLQSN